MEQIPITYDKTFMTQFKTCLQKNEELTSWSLFKLNYEAVKSRMAHSFTKLNTLNYLPHMTFLDHQIKAAEDVIRNMNGRAILADEVGLGKTIEAGLILKEYMIRGLVKRALILVPASLVNQWIKELNEKFYIDARKCSKNEEWNQHAVYVTSLDRAKRSPHKERLEEIDFDFVLVDEAHKLKNEKTINYQFVRSLKKTYCLLLTATPIQNELSDVFNLVTILKPGYLGSYDSFKKTYRTKETQHFNDLIKKVMVRHTREKTKLNDITRHVKTIWIDFSPEEQSVYNKLTELVHNSRLAKINYLKQFCSSREACYLSLKKLDEDKENPILAEIASLPHHTKAKQLITLLKDIGNEKVIIFTQYHATQYYLQWYLNKHKISSLAFRGGYSASKKDWITQLFKGNHQVLIATEAGAEGINLQFCHHLINYDLPWNPMRLEQRIGRIHRYGQANDIHIYNFALKETLEEHLMNILYEKINLFETAIGKLDDILERLNIKLDDEINSIVHKSASIGELNIKFNNLTAIIDEAQHGS